MHGPGESEIYNNQLSKYGCVDSDNSRLQVWQKWAVPTLLKVFWEEIICHKQLLSFFYINLRNSAMKSYFIHL